jgi:urocanate hydratase
MSGATRLRWPPLNALLYAGAPPVSITMAAVWDTLAARGRRIVRWNARSGETHRARAVNDPAIGVVRHADAGYEAARQVAQARA